MDIDRYLDRIGMTREGRAPDLAFLDELIYAHQLHVPFETIDVYDFRKVPSLDLDDLFDKIVVRRRGGYCFELNALFCALLRELGYDVWPASFCISPTGEPRLVNHRTSVVNYEGFCYMVDVGMGGPMPSFALRFDGGRQSGIGETYWLDDTGNDWLIFKRLRTSGGQSEELVRGGFDPRPVGEEAFDEPNLRMASSPESSFCRIRQANMRIADGHCTITGDMYSETHDGVRTEMPIDEIGGLYEVLASKFGIVIPELCESDWAH